MQAAAAQTPPLKVLRMTVEIDRSGHMLRLDGSRSRRLVQSSGSEDYHQQYLDKVPNGYCPIHATGVKLPDDFKVAPLQYVD
jgi:hypothetical protein